MHGKKWINNIRLYLSYMKLMTRYNFFKILFFFFATLSVNDVCSSPKPFVIPEIKEWRPQKGNFKLEPSSRIVYSSDNLRLKQIAEILADDIYLMFNKKISVVKGKSREGDIFLNLDTLKFDNNEEYSIKISNKVLLNASHHTGLYWSTRTVLQILEQNDSKFLPKGIIHDYPDYPMRGFMIDCGRKYIPMSYLNDLVKIMSYYKMNVLQVHLNDNGFKQYYEHDWQKTYAAFRLECETYPGLAAFDGYYTKKEFKDFQNNAFQLGVEIIPEIDIPAHSLCFSQYTDGIGSDKYGYDHLDLFTPKTYSFIDTLLDEYLGGTAPVFIGKRFNIGTDEYSNETTEIVEQFRYFTDYYINKVESYGKQACMWGALTHAKGSTPVKVDNVIINSWFNDFADPKEMIDLGYQLISMNDWQVYIVPGASYYHDYLNIEKLYNNWTPNTIGNQTFEPRHKSILGGMFALWNDHVGNGISVKDIHHRIYPVIQTMSTKNWSAHSYAVTYDEFNQKRHDLSEAPGVNQMGKIGNIPALIYHTDQVESHLKTGLCEIGYDYTIEFLIDPKKELKGTYLFDSPNSIFYLADPINGFMGYERDGYLNTFRYTVQDGKKAHVEIKGDSKSVTLTVDGKLIDHMNIQQKFFNGGKDSISYYRTFVFPLQNVGEFNSKVSDLKIYNYCK